MTSTPTVYAVANSDGFPITDGLQEIAEARRHAQEIANSRGEDVELVEHEVGADLPWPDGEWISPREERSYTIRRPISADPALRHEGMVVSRHRTLAGAQRALARQQRGARRQGGWSQDYIWDDRADREA